MAYNDDQAEIDAMSSMSTSNVRTAPVAYDPELRSQIGLLSRTIDSLSRKLDTVSEVSGIKGNHMPERIAASIGGPIGLSVVSAFKQLNLGEQISEKVGGLFSRFKGSRDESNGGFLNPSSMSKINFQSASMITDTLKSEVSRPLITANSLAKQQQEITKRGNIAVVKSIGQLNETIANKLTAEQVQELRRANNELISSIQKSNQKIVAEQRYRSSQQDSEESTINEDSDLSSVTSMLERISEQLDSFQDPNGEKGGILKGAFEFFTTRIRAAFYGKYSRQIPRSNNPLQTIADASLKMYEWQRLYGEVTKEQLNEVIRKLGGTEKKIVGRKGAVWEWMANNPESWQRMKNMLGNSDTVSGKLASWLMKGYEYNSQFDEETWIDNILTSVKKSSQNGKPITGLKDFYDRITGSGEFDVERLPDHISKMENGPKKDAALAKWRSENRVDNENLRRRLFNTWTAKQGKTVEKITTYSDPYFNTPTNNGPAITPIHPNPIYNDQLDGVITGTIPVTIMGGAPIEKLVESSQHTAKYTQKIFDDDQGDEREASAEDRYNKYKNNQGTGSGEGSGDGTTKNSNSVIEEGKSWLRTLATYTPVLATTAGSLLALSTNKKFNLVNHEDVNDETKLASDTAAARQGARVGYKVGEAARKGINKTFAKAEGTITKVTSKLPKPLKLVTKPATATMTATRGILHGAGYLGKGAAWTAKKVLTPVASGMYAYDAGNRFMDDQDIRAIASGANSALMWVPGMGWVTSVGLDTATSMGDRTQAELQRNGILELEARNAGDTVTAGVTRSGYIATKMTAPYLRDTGIKAINKLGESYLSNYASRNPYQMGPSSIANVGKKLLNKGESKVADLALKAVNLGKDAVADTAGKSLAKVGLKTVGKIAGGVTAAMDVSDSIKRFNQGDKFGGSMAALSGLSTLGAMGAMAAGGKIGAWGGPIGIGVGALAGGLIVLNDIKRSQKHMVYADDTENALTDPSFVFGKDNKKIVEILEDKDLDSFNKTKKISELWKKHRSENCISLDPARELVLMNHNDMFINSPEFREYMDYSKEFLAENGLDPKKPIAMWTSYYQQWKHNKLETLDKNYINDIYHNAQIDEGFKDDYTSKEAIKLLDDAKNRGVLDDDQYKGEIYWLYHDYADRARKFNYKTGNYDNQLYSDMYNFMNEQHGVDTMEINSTSQLRNMSKHGNTSASSILEFRKQRSKKKDSHISNEGKKKPEIQTQTISNYAKERMAQWKEDSSKPVPFITDEHGNHSWNTKWLNYHEYKYDPNRLKIDPIDFRNMMNDPLSMGAHDPDFQKLYGIAPAITTDQSWISNEDKKKLHDTNTLRATNKVYSQQQAMKPLIKEVKEGTQQQVKAVNNSTAAVTTTIKTVNNTIINNGSNNSNEDVPYYQSVTGTSGENL